MAYKDLTQAERAEPGRKLADALEQLQEEESSQAQVKKTMKARLEAIRSDVSLLKTEVRSGKEWIDEQGVIEFKKGEE